MLEDARIETYAQSGLVRDTQPTVLEKRVGEQCLAKRVGVDVVFHASAPMLRQRGEEVNRRDETDRAAEVMRREEAIRAGLA